MATLYVNYKSNCEASSAESCEEVTVAGTNTVGTKTTKGNCQIEFFCTAATYVSIGAAPNALTDPGRFIVFPSFPARANTTKGMKIACATA